MAVSPTVERLTSEPEVIQVTWVLTTADPTGVAVDFPQHRDRNWEFSGTWGGATAAAQGANTNTDSLFGAVSNANGGLAITATADGVTKNQLESCRFVRPKLTTVGVGASITVVLIAATTKRF